MAADRIVYCLEQLTDYRQFERLCSDLMNQSGYRDIEPLGGSNDGGRDAVHISRTLPAEITIFAYSARPDWLRKLNEDCGRIQKERHVCHRLVFVSTAAITSAQRDAAQQSVFDKYGWSLELHDLERLRTRLSGDLRHLLAQHPAIFCPPFFPTAGGLSISESRDTIVIDHTAREHALASWLARRLQLVGYRTWAYGNAPLAGETSDDSVRTLIDKRALRYLPLLSASSVSNSDFIGRCGVAAGIDQLVIPCHVEAFNENNLPTKLRRISQVDFKTSWAVGLQQLMHSMESSGISPAMSPDQGRAIAVRSYLPEPLTRAEPETVFTNTFRVKVPAAIQVCELERCLSSEEEASLRRVWAYAEASPEILLAFEDPPATVPLRRSLRREEYSWSDFDSRYGKRSFDAVKEIVRRSLDVICARAGLQWCDDRELFYFPHLTDNVRRNVPFIHVDGRKTRVAVTGEKAFGKGGAKPFRYQLCPIFRVGRDDDGRWWATMKLYVRVTDSAGVPFAKKDITRRRKKVAKSWWNKEWLARTMGVMQALGDGNDELVVGCGSRQLTIATSPMTWSCPVSIDYRAVARIGDFQEEWAQLLEDRAESESADHLEADKDE